MKNNYVVTAVTNDSNELYLSAIFEETETDRELINIIQNSKVSEEINEDHIKLFIARIQKCSVSDLPDLTKFLKTNVHILEAKKKISNDDITLKLDI